MGLGRVGVAFAAGGRAAGVAAGDAAGVDQADGGELGGQLAIALLVVGQRWRCLSVASRVSFSRGSVSTTIPDSRATVWYRVVHVHQTTRSDPLSNNRRRRTARLRAEATAIERRLARAVGPNMSGPVLGRANIAYELSARTKATVHGGIGAIAKLIGDVGLACRDRRLAAVAQAAQALPRVRSRA